jgi:hypothetical protein
MLSYQNKARTSVELEHLLYSQDFDCLQYWTIGPPQVSGKTATSSSCSIIMQSMGVFFHSFLEFVSFFFLVSKVVLCFIVDCAKSKA